MIGAVLDKYEVEQKIGEGGMATVYRGRHLTLGRDVAIKVLHPHLSSSARNRQRFAREARAIEQLRHPNILEIFDYSGSDSSECYIITEFVQGETLTTLVQRTGPLPSEVVAMIGLQLCDALQYAHDAGILHRDLKPDNVMIRADGAVKLMDFGIARFLDESQVTMTGALVGSPAFMSPEQAREGVLDARSDLFSLGTLLFYLASGHLPFAGSNPSLILKNIIEGNRPALSDLVPTLSATLADTVERLMQPDREERFREADAVAESLRESLAETQVAADTPRWSLQSFLSDHERYQQRLDEHLGATLLVQGRTHLEAGDPLSALRLFNRLLCIDPDNEAVLRLVQGMHTERATPRTRPRVLPGLIGLAFLAVGAGAVLWTSSHQAQDEPIELPSPGTSAAVVAPPAPGDVIVTPTVVPVSVHPTSAVLPSLRPHRPLTDRPPRPEALTVPKRPQPPTVQDAAAPGFVEIRVEPPFWGDIYEGSRQVGSTRDQAPIALSLGRHQLTVRNPLMEDYTLEVDILSGQTVSQRGIHLSPRPAEVRFERTLSGECVVVVDGSARGTLEAIGFRTALAAPDEAHRVVVTCGDAVYTQRFAELMSPVVTFDPGAAP